MKKLQVILLFLLCSWSGVKTQGLTGPLLLYEGDSITTVEDIYTDKQGTAWVLFTKPFASGVLDLCLAAVLPQGYLASSPKVLYSASPEGESTQTIFRADIAGSFSTGELVVSVNLGIRGQGALMRYRINLLIVEPSESGPRVVSETALEYRSWLGYKQGSVLISQEDHLFLSEKFLNNPFTTTLLSFKKLDCDLHALWGEEGYQMVAGEQLLVNGYAIPSPGDGCMILYKDDMSQAGSADRHYYLRRLDALGNNLWDRDILVSVQPGLLGWDFPLFAGDSGDFFILANGSDIARYLPDGTNAYPTDNPPALPVNDSIVTSTYLRRVLGRGMVYVEFMKRQKDQFPGTDSLVFGQLFNASGERLWGYNGKAVDKGSLLDSRSFRNSGDTLIRYYHKADNPAMTSTISYTLQTQAFDGTGNLLWRKELGPYPGSVSVSDFFNGQATLIYKETTSTGQQRLMATALHSDGRTGFQTTSFDSIDIKGQPTIRIFPQSNQILIENCVGYEFYRLVDIHGHIVSIGPVSKTISTLHLLPNLYLLTLYSSSLPPYTSKLFIN